jgi:hypothetical protein
MEFGKIASDCYEYFFVMMFYDFARYCFSKLIDDLSIVPDSHVDHLSNIYHA